MSDHEDKYNNLRSVLHNLLECVLQKAKNDESFANDLVKILEGDSLKRIKTKTTKSSERNILNPITILKDHGEPYLCNILNSLPNDEIVSIAVSQNWMKKKEAKSLNRDDLISEILIKSKMKLRQGMTIAGIDLKSQSTSEESSDLLSKTPDNNASDKI